MKAVMNKENVEVPLPSQEGNKSAVQYALYVKARFEKGRRDD